jgi:putative membrane protein
MPETERKPRAIPIPDDEDGRPRKRPGDRRPRTIPTRSLAYADDSEADPGEPDIALPQRRRWPWWTLLLSALAGLGAMAIGIAVDDFVRTTFARNDWLGWAAAVFGAIAAVAAAALILRELRSLFRQRAVRHLRDEVAVAHAQDDIRLARKAVAELRGFYSDRPDQSRGRVAVKELADNVFDGADLLTLTERELMRPLDAMARAQLSAAARRVALVTAVSPRAVVDLAYVLFENLRLISSISRIYGGRPTTLGMFRLVRNVLAHLAATGAIAAGESVLQQLVGHGLAAKLSARLGEGVVNGLMTARIGIAAIEVCRPMPFLALARPRLADLAKELGPNVFSGAKSTGLDKDGPSAA